MFAASEGTADTHHGRVRILALTTLLLFAASLFSTGPALAEPKTELLAQTIDFTLPEIGTVGEVLPLEGTASSGLPLTFEAKPPSRCAVEATGILLIAEGKCKVDAIQAGDDGHASAEMSVEIQVVAPQREPQIQPQPEPKPKAEPEPKAKAKPKPEPKAKAQPKPEPKAKAQPKPEPKAKAEPKPKAKPKAKAESKSGPQGKAKPEPEAKAEPKPKAEPKATPEPPGQAEEKAEHLPEAQTATSAAADGLPTLSVGWGWATEGDSGTVETTGAYVYLSAPSDTDVSFDYATADDTATAPSDYIAKSGTIIIPAGSTKAEWTVTVNGDTEWEPDERFDILVSNVIGATLNPESDPHGEIYDDDTVELWLENAGVKEGDSGTIELTGHVHVFPPSDADVSFEYATADDTATAPSDYIAKSGAKVTIPAGSTQAEWSVTINGDTEWEPSERFEILVSNVIGAVFVGGGDYGEIYDDDTIELWLTDGYAWEGDSGTTELRGSAYLLRPSDADVSFEYGTADDTATAPSDYIAKSGVKVTIPAGSREAEWSVTINGDTYAEPDERIEILVSNVVGANFYGGGDYGWIRDDDAPSYWVIAENIAEGDTGTREMTFEVYLSAPYSVDLSMNYRGIGGATPGVDFIDQRGSITIPAGATYAEFSIPVIGDTEVELDEYIRGSAVIDGLGSADPSASDPYGWILNDDGPRELLLDSYGLEEGNSGTSELTFEAWLTLPSATDVSFDYSTQDDTATAPSDYIAESGTITIPADGFGTTFSITVNGDTEPEMDEWFEIVVSDVVGATYDADGSYPWGDIWNDDLPSMSIDDVSVVEGTGGETAATLTISLNGPTSDWVGVHVSTADGTAKDPADYMGGEAWLTLEPGYVGWLIDVAVVGDSIDEPNETFSVRLSSPLAASIADDTGTITIIDDDPLSDTTPPNVSAPAIDFARGRTLTRTAKPIPLNVRFSATDPSGISATRLQHRTGTGPYANVRLAAASTATSLQPSSAGTDMPRASMTARKIEPGTVAPTATVVRPAAALAGTGTRATVNVGTRANVVHRFRSQATDGVGNTSPFAEAPATRVKVVQDGSRAVKRTGPWAAKRAGAFFGGTVKRTTRKGARVQLTARGTDFAIVATKGRDKGKARVIVDGKPVGVVDLYAPKAKPRTIVHAVSFAKPGRHTVALQALGKKNPRAKGKRVELDAFLVLTP